MNLIDGPAIVMVRSCSCCLALLDLLPEFVEIGHLLLLIEWGCLFRGNLGFLLWPHRQRVLIRCLQVQQGQARVVVFTLFRDLGQQAIIFLFFQGCCWYQNWSVKGCLVHKRELSR